MECPSRRCRIFIHWPNDSGSLVKVDVSLAVPLAELLPTLVDLMGPNTVPEQPLCWKVETSSHQRLKEGMSLFDQNVYEGDSLCLRPIYAKGYYLGDDMAQLVAQIVGEEPCREDKKSSWVEPLVEGMVLLSLLFLGFGYWVLG